VTPQTPKKRSSERLRDLWPDIKELIRPRRGMLALGFLMMAIGTPCGLVLPASTKYLVDDVIGKKQIHLLLPLVMVVMAATVIRGITSYGQTQLVSKAGQRLIAELRRKVQTHVAHLPVAYYDANKTGTLVARIMNDVEGIRNLLGTGLIEFVGGVLTAVLVLGYLLYLNWILTAIALAIVVGFALVLRKAFGIIRPIFRERAKINAKLPAASQNR